MSRDGSTTFFWADGEHRFCLQIGGIRELEEKCKAGSQEIFLRVAQGRWRIDDLRETIRLGLIGGGMAPADAHLLLARYFDLPSRPKLEAVEPTLRILKEALTGSEDEPLGKGTPAGENATTTTGTASPDGARSTEPAPPSGSPLATSTNGRSGNSLQ